MIIIYLVEIEDGDFQPHDSCWVGELRRSLTPNRRYELPTGWCESNGPVRLYYSRPWGFVGCLRETLPDGRSASAQCGVTWRHRVAADCNEAPRRIK